MAKRCLGGVENSRGGCGSLLVAKEKRKKGGKGPSNYAVKRTPPWRMNLDDALMNCQAEFTSSDELSGEAKGLWKRTMLCSVPVKGALYLWRNENVLIEISMQRTNQSRRICDVSASFHVSKTLGVSAFLLSLSAVVNPPTGESLFVV